jgi:hypothetical protein
MLFRHHPADLVQVRQVVRHPGGQELPERHRPELGMLALERQLLVRQRPRCERRNALGAAPSELVQQLGEPLALALAAATKSRSSAGLACGDTPR